MTPETPGRIEPCFPERITPDLADALSGLTAQSLLLGSKLPPATASDLADVVRLMNCYYSNLIEGHNTRPREIERALKDDLEVPLDRRNLQLEARAHVRVQAKLDALHAQGKLPEPASIDFIRWLHREFYEGIPDEMLWVGEGVKRTRMTPGEFRSGSQQNVAVGRHLPPSSDHLESFMLHFQDRFRFASLSPSLRLIGTAAAHHRFNFIHPFLDGNGRVSRLMSHAMALHAGIGSHGLWSISRGLARGLRGRDEYKQMMDFADMPRENDLDGRGNLSMRALEGFVQWFMDVSLDQVRFMSGLLSLDGLSARLRKYLQGSLAMRPEAADLAEEILRRGELPRGAATRVTGLSERTARDLLGMLAEKGVVGSSSPKGPVSIRFPAAALDALFPQLFIDPEPGSAAPSAAI